MSNSDRPIARLSQRVMFHAPITQIDGHGLATQGFTEAGEVWACLRPTGARADSEAGTRFVFAGFEAEIRAPHPVAAGWRLQAGTRVFRVRDVVTAPAPDSTGSGRLILALSGEVSADG